MNYRLLRANGGSGYEALSNFIHDALLYPTAYARVSTTETTESLVTISGRFLPNQLQDLFEDENVEILEYDSREIMVDQEVPMAAPPGPPQPMPGMPPGGPATDANGASWCASAPSWSTSWGTPWSASRAASWTSSGASAYADGLCSGRGLRCALPRDEGRPRARSCVSAS